MKHWRLRLACSLPSFTFAAWWVWMGLPAVPEPHRAIGWVVGGASVATTFLLGLKRTEGWVLMIVNQAGWGWVAIGTGQDGLMASTLVFLSLGITNLVLWIQDPPRRKETLGGKHRAPSGVSRDDHEDGSGLLEKASA